MSLAGLWEGWGKGPEPLESFTIITTTPNKLVEPIHDRMPAILAPEDFDVWLEPRESPIAQVLVRPCPASKLEGADKHAGQQPEER